MDGLLIQIFELSSSLLVGSTFTMYFGLVEEGQELSDLPDHQIISVQFEIIDGMPICLDESDGQETDSNVG